MRLRFDGPSPAEKQLSKERRMARRRRRELPGQPQGVLGNEAVTRRAAPAEVARLEEQDRAAGRAEASTKGLTRAERVERERRAGAR